jgi:YjjG family noncanonical pyrimidine nucleotidase
MDRRILAAVLLDADNTLFDFDLAQREALLESIGLGPGSPGADEAFAAFKAVNEAAWREHEAGLMDRNTLRTERFRRFREVRPFARPLEEVAEAFLELLSTKGKTFSGVPETLVELRAHGLRLALATNGFSRVQRGRLAASGLTAYFDGVFISEEMGTKKPDQEFFDRCLGALGVGKGEAVMVGDSPAADIAGAKAAGMGTVWINPDRLPYPPDLPGPDIELSTVNDLPRVLGLCL